MRKFSSILFVALLAATSMGCDSGTDTDDAERLVGTWTLIGISDGTGDVSPGFVAAYSSIKVTTSAAKTFTIVAAPVSGASTTYTGGYAISQPLKKITLNAVVLGNTVPLVFTYNFASDTQMTLTSLDTSLLNLLFNPTTPLQGTIVLTVAKL